MDQISAIIAANGGSIERYELLDLGWTDASIRDARRAGTIERIRYGTYACGPTWRASTPAERLRLRTYAVIGKLGRNVYASHHSAAAVHGLDLYGIDVTRVHVGRLDHRSGRVDAGVHYHRGHIDESELTEVNGCLVVRPERAAIESALISTLESGMVVATSLLRTGRTEADELQRLARSQFDRWPGSAVAEQAIARADPRLETVGEVRSMHLFATHGIPTPTPQGLIVNDDGEFVARTDYLWERHRHVGEFDGLAKYGRLNPYVHDPGRTIVDEKRREDAIRAQAYGVSRWTWGDLDVGTGAGTAARIKRDLEASRRLYSGHRVVIV